MTHGQDMAGGAVTGATLTMLEESFDVLFTSPVELDPNMKHLMITAAGHDKPGWVAQLSRAVSNAGGNVTHSRMVRLGEEFIILMHVSVMPDKFRSLVSQIKSNKDLKPLNIQCNPISRRKTGTYEAAVMGVHLRCVGSDK